MIKHHFLSLFFIKHKYQNKGYKMYKKILLVSNPTELTLPYGSKMDILTSRDPKPVKILKYLKGINIDSILSTTLEGEYIKDANLLVYFDESDLKIDQILSFCEKNECDLLILKKENVKLSKSYNFKIIHSTNLFNYISIYEKIISEIKAHYK